MRAAKDDAHPTETALYTRVSTEHQVKGDDDSLKTQEDLLRRYAEARRWVVVKMYCDEALSGKDMDRPALEKLMTDAKAGLFRRVLVYKYDRITRSVRDLIYLIDEFERLEVSFVSITECVDTATPQGRLLVTFIGGLAEFERRMTSARTKDKMQWRAGEGLWNGGTVPYGYQATENKRLIPHPKASREVQRAFELYLELRSTPQVMARLKSEFPHGRNWSKSNLANVIANPIYTGQLSYAKKLYKGQHEALISQETFDQAKEILKANRTNRGSTNRQTKHGLAIHKVAHCICGQALRISMTYSGKEATRRRYFWAECKHSKVNTTGERCTVRRIQGKVIEGALIDLIGQVAKDPDIIARAMNEHAKLVEHQLRKGKDELAGLEGDLKTLEDRIQQLRTPVDGADLEKVRQELAQLLAERDQLQGRIGKVKALRPAPLPSRRNLADLQKSLELFRLLYSKLTVAERIELFEAFFDKVVWTGENLVVHFKGNGVTKRIPWIDKTLDVRNALDHVPVGMTVRSERIGKVEVCSDQGCKNLVHAKGLCQDHYKKAMRGEGKAEHTTTGKGKLTQEQVDEIRSLHKTGKHSLRKLAERFGVSHITVRQIVKGRIWKQAP